MLDAEHFQSTLKVASDSGTCRSAGKSKLNLLPPNPETSDPTAAVGNGRFPSWLHRPLPKGSSLWRTGDVLKENRLPTVCEEAGCPNHLECWSKKTATFLALGKQCTRSCGFCDIDFSKAPPAVEHDEPFRIADSVAKLGLKHVVVTMVARDDLEDGGAAHIAEIVREVRRQNEGVTIELLISDLGGSERALDTVLEARPDIFNHNIETVRSLSQRVRHTATYERTLSVLAYAKKNRVHPAMYVKSGIMVGLGETKEEVEQTLIDLAQVGCDIVTIGQYLQPNRRKLLVKTFVHPDEFKYYEEFGRSVGINQMYCGPFVRSSYNADLTFYNAKELAHEAR